MGNEGGAIRRGPEGSEKQRGKKNAIASKIRIERTKKRMPCIKGRKDGPSPRARGMSSRKNANKGKGRGLKKKKKNPGEKGVV